MRRYKPDPAADARRDERARLADAIEKVAAKQLADNRRAALDASRVYRDGYTLPYKWEARGKCAPQEKQAAHVDVMRKFGAGKAATTRAVSHYARKYGVEDAAIRIRVAKVKDALRANGVDV